MMAMGRLGRLLVLLAVLVMPLGMARAAAAMPSMAHHAVMSVPAMEHCPDQSSKHDDNAGPAMCSMACASALPAQDLVRDEMPLQASQLVVATPAETLRGILMEIATPPPNLS